ncbi:MAG TPA: DUF3857 domain-containing protein [Chitinophagaceae bacterium]|nr:DUF3857 domain-containing protein [Chitinophagaceae bacterium]
MKILILSLLALAAPGHLFAQQDGFPYGQISTDDLKMKSYNLDSTANAVVLNEFGETYVQSADNYNIIHKYHEVVKIFNENGFDAATIKIPLQKDDQGEDKVYDIQGSTYNLVNGQVRVTSLNPSQIYTLTLNKDFDEVKFTLPDLQPGSVIEVSYTFESPHFTYFKEWRFQSDIPKVHSEYWTKIPANYTYNIVLRGFLRLDKNKGSIISGCLQSASGTSDCSFYQYAMDNIPAFHQEDFMTSPENYLSAIHYELSQIQTYDGRVINYSQQWKDVDQFLLYNVDFGKQLKKGMDVLKPIADLDIASTAAGLERAHKIYRYFRDQYHYNGDEDFLTENGVKKAFEDKAGNVADINLSLIAALRDAGFTADPVLLATRDQEVPNHINPVIVEFNYIIARVEVGDTVYLVDATHRLLPFGVLPFKCMNGQGRWFRDRSPSAWIDIPPTTNNLESDLLSIQVSSNGSLNGTLTRLLEGYKAYDERVRILGYRSEDEYIDHLTRKWGSRMISYSIDSLKDPQAPLLETLQLKLPGNFGQSGEVFFNPFLLRTAGSNPFQSEDRLFPVDFGVPPQIRTVIKINFPDDYAVESLPQNMALALPDHGGRFLLGIDTLGSEVIVSSLFDLSNPVFPAAEYGSLRELYSRVYQAEQADIVFKRK